MPLSLPNLTRVRLEDRADKHRREGHSILQLGSTDPAVFDLHAPDPILHDVVAALPSAQGYSDHQGIFAARRSVALHYETVPGFPKIDHSDVWLGNGSSELILMSMRALLDDPADEVLVPRPGEPIWPSAVLLAGGTVVPYECREDSGWDIDLDDVAALITDRTRAIVVSHPNNPVGRIYSEQTLEELTKLAARHGIVIFSDETVGRVLYPPTSFVPTGVFARKTLCLTFDSLSYSYRAPGYRAGWMVVSGTPSVAPRFLDAMAVLSDLRWSANTLGQNAIQVALGGRQTIAELTAPGGRLWEQRTAAIESVARVPGLRCHEPDGGFSMFLGIDDDVFPSDYDRARFAEDLLDEQHVLVEPSDCFGLAAGTHFRVTFLARERTFDAGMQRIGAFLQGLRSRS